MRQVSYSIKSLWTQKVRYFDDAGKKRTAHRRLGNALHVGWLVARDQFPLVDFNSPARSPPIWEPEIQAACKLSHGTSGLVPCARLWTRN